MKFQMQYNLILIFIFLLVCNNSHAQEATNSTLSKMSLYADIGGGFDRGLASINYEHRILSSKKLTWYGRVGIGAGGTDEGGPGGLAAISMLTGKRNGHFEVSGGTFIGSYADDGGIFVLPILDVGYRYQPPRGGLLFRTRVGLLGIGFSLGYAF